MHNMICVKDKITRHIKGINFWLEEEEESNNVVK